MDSEDAKLNPLDNVYSYFMFVVPLERRKNPGGFSWNVAFAWLLIGLNLFVQGTLLYAIFASVVAGDVVWRNGIINLEGKSAHPFAPPPSKCNPGGSLCIENNGTYSCAPPSVQLAGRWDMLDLNSDGIWTKEEVLKAQEDLKCQFAVDPVEVFSVFVSFLKKRADVIWLHPLVQSGQALPKPYFDFAKGDIIMCSYRNEEMCPNLLKRGFFDGPLMSGKSPRVGKTIDSALKYCYDLLAHGGVCERSLPSAYSVWRKSSAKQCLDQEYNKFNYKHPKTGMTKSLLEVDYAAVTDYERGRSSNLFRIFKSIIILMFVLCMVVELNDILIVVTWVLTFPSEEDVDEAVVLTGRSQLESPSTTRSFDGTTRSAAGDLSPTSHQSFESNASTKYTIRGISAQHRMMVGFLCLIRIVVAVLLTWVGTVFLLQDTDYVNLLLNSVGLVFIVEIASCLYAQLLSAELRETFESTDPFTVSMASFWKVFWIRNVALRDMVRLACVAALLGTCMYLHYVNVARPLSTALECTCLSQGDQCFEAKEFNKDFWKTYWDHDVPQVFAFVDKMKKEHKANADNDQSEVLVHDNPSKSLSDKTQQFATLKVLPWDLETVPSQIRHKDAHRKSSHHGTRLLNNRHHRVVDLLNGPNQ